MRLTYHKTSHTHLLWGEEAGTLRLLSDTDKLIPLLCRLASGALPKVTITMRDGARMLRINAALDW